MAPAAFSMARSQAEAGLWLCLDKVAHAIGGAEIVCRHGGHETVAVYLYTVAIEELGKALLIRDMLGEAGEDGIVDVPREWFAGRNAHKNKFDRAHRELPEECIIYQKAYAVYDPEKVPRDHARLLRDGMEAVRASEEDEAAEYKRRGMEAPNHLGDCVVALRYDKDKKTYTAGAFSPLLYDAGRVFIPILFDFATRKNMLYADWDDDKKRWNRDATVGTTRFVRGVCDWHAVEVDKDESELYPDVVLDAATALRDAVSGIDWPPGKISEKAREIGAGG